MKKFKSLLNAGIGFLHQAADTTAKVAKEAAGTTAKVAKKAAAIALSGMIAVGCAVPLATAASDDIIDTTRTGSISVCKYDITAAEADGKADLIATLPTNGERNDTIISALRKYALPGSEFTISKIAEIGTYSDENNLTTLAYTTNGTFAHLLSLTDSNGATASTASVDGASLTFTGTVLNDALHELLTESTLSNTQTKNALDEYLSNLPASEKKSGVTNEDGFVEFKNLPLGLYIVEETKVPENVTYTVNPFFMSVPCTNRMDANTETVNEENAGTRWNYDPFAFPKNQNMTNDLLKKVREHKENNQYAKTCTGSEGDTIDCLLTTELAPVTSVNTSYKKLQFEDTLSKGLVYDSAYGVNIAFYKDRKDAEAGQNPILQWNTNSTSFTSTLNTLDSGESKLTIALTETGLRTVSTTDDGQIPGTARDGKSDFSCMIMAVSYRCTLTSGAKTVLGDNGNPNKVRLTWQRTNDNTSKTIQDRAEVYTYGIDLTKQFETGKDGGAATADNYKAVKFTLKNKTDNYFVNATGENGVYYVNDQTQAADESHGTEFSPSSTGSLIINGLEADTYVLTEVNTANGYHLLKSPIEIVITPTETAIVASTASQTGLKNGVEFSRTLTSVASATVKSDSSGTAKNATMKADGESEHARVAMTVVNTKGFDLPKTGGMGTTVVTVAGITLVAAGAMLLILPRIKRKEK